MLTHVLCAYAMHALHGNFASDTDQLCPGAKRDSHGMDIKLSMHTSGCMQGVMEGVPASKDYKGGFACKLMHKDLCLASAAAQHCNATVPMSTEAAKLYKQVTLIQHSCNANLTAVIGLECKAPVTARNRVCHCLLHVWLYVV